MYTPTSAPMRYLLLLTATWLGIFALTRAILFFSHLEDAGHAYFSVFATGLLSDLVFLVYAALPLCLLFLMCPQRLWQTRAIRWLLQGVLAASIYVMLFTAVSEWLFWDEFGVRFNFIAVDYLVYSDEVLNNIRESYPVGTLLGILAVLTLVLCLALRPLFNRALQAPFPIFRQRLLPAISMALLTGLSIQFIDQNSLHSLGGNTYQRELASNGPYQFFAAFRNNELDYQQFYSTLPEAVSAQQIRAELNEPGVTFIAKSHWIYAAR